MNSSKSESVPSAEFARSIIRKLRDAGFDAWLAGGCVRDRLMGVEPKDYDVATSARPEAVRSIFGQRSTVAVGEAFGVVVVHGRKPALPVEVATFRRDATYSDGRHPDSVEFTSAEEDAHRRDFTINAIFYDPLDDRVIDYVDGTADIRNRIVRAVGDPVQRFREDHLRMLRAVRFATTLQFTIDPATLAAIVQNAERVRAVSAERIATEMRKILASPHRAVGLQLLRDSCLLAMIFPELDRLADTQSAWSELKQAAGRLASLNFATSLGCLLYAIVTSNPSIALDPLATTVAHRWRLSRKEAKQSHWLTEHLPTIMRSTSRPWPVVQRRLVHPDRAELLSLAAAWISDPVHDPDLAFCRQKLALPREQLDPPVLLTGEDLIRWGIERGPRYAQVLEFVRDAQLEGKIMTVEDAQALARRWLSDRSIASD